LSAPRVRRFWVGTQIARDLTEKSFELTTVFTSGQNGSA
jgi:hypothetical protein